ncbi:MAG: inositol monophosphatase family protein [Chloroflexia bacterium]
MSDMQQSDNDLARDTAIAAARAAGAISRRGFLEPRTVKPKGPHDIVTEIDEASEDAICDLLLSAFPDDGLLAEERGRYPGRSPYTWVIDPLDGTFNYAAQLPFWCVSIARYNRTTEQVELGVVFDPLHDELFVAERGKGATLNGKPIHVAQVTELSRSMVACDIGYVQEISRRMLNAAVQVQPEVRRLRILGSAVLAMAYVANGRIDAFFHLHLQPWDLAAAWLLIEEAGGRCINWFGGPTHLDDHEVVAAPPAVCEALARKIAPFRGDQTA